MFNENNSILIYDGDCGFCNASLIFAYKHLKVMPAVEPFQNESYKKFNLSLSEVENAVFLCSKELDEKLRGHLAIAEILTWQPQLRFRILGKVMSNRLLSPLFGFGYRLVAKYRRYLPGGTPTCGIKPPKNES